MAIGLGWIFTEVFFYWSGGNGFNPDLVSAPVIFNEQFQFQSQVFIILDCFQNKCRSFMIPLPKCLSSRQNQHFIRRHCLTNSISFHLVHIILDRLLVRFWNFLHNEGFEKIVLFAREIQCFTEPFLVLFPIFRHEFRLIFEKIHKSEIRILFF